MVNFVSKIKMVIVKKVALIAIVIAYLPVRDFSMLISSCPVLKIFHFDVFHSVGVNNSHVQSDSLSNSITFIHYIYRIYSCKRPTSNKRSP